MIYFTLNQSREVRLITRSAGLSVVSCSPHHARSAEGVYAAVIEAWSSGATQMMTVMTIITDC